MDFESKRLRMDANNLKDHVVSINFINIDKEIGKRIKEARLTCGMSQDDLGKKVGVTFQQIQKYEKGINRVLVSRLCDIAKALSKDIVYFFPDIPNTGNNNPSTYSSTALSEDSSSFEYNRSEDDAESKEILVLVREYQKIKNKKSRSAVYSLIKSLSSSQD
ncbi:MAG: helix-turn-helix transcriptional regulator [Wolbachia sp.]|nr:helix-turn-helix transcriptional regulator [Wolbachia sp.]MDD9336565.1 helix-turn-helix transcriptional regulator [Wolbachia sp.]